MELARWLKMAGHEVRQEVAMPFFKVIILSFIWRD
jgi:hypothetical protein